ncbi:hypothetical protein IVB22_34695 [Bradyrhizobium sp. 190]|uniref:hypothetical protein n=1 Tax=Bradyrhizobium sp. 190 TaxID=2782658 RepID=UPI001FF771D2|nr:hypothetical protein [Bradyrhizobium sp. 190]MCK1517545.1 hypothetical protein [Bradyrhizobium sp. 190]
MTTDTTITPELLDQLLANYKKPEDLTDADGLFKQLKKALIERVDFEVASAVISTKCAVQIVIGPTRRAAAALGLRRVCERARATFCGTRAACWRRSSSRAPTPR